MTNKNKKLHVKTSDRVIVLAGKDKGKIGNIKKVDPTSSKVVVEGVNMVTKSQKPQPAAGIQGGFVKLEAPMDSSKVMVVCPGCEKPTRIKHEVKADKKVRVCKKCGEQLDV
jgi:large subunit ribosomal protein L24